MDDAIPPNPPDDPTPPPEPPGPPDPDQPANPDDGASTTGDGMTQQIRHQQVSALVPEHVARGVFSTGAIALTGQQEFVLDFIVALTRPHQVAARIIIPQPIMPKMVQALKVNLTNYRKRFGEPPQLPAPPQPTQQPSFEEVYKQLKLNDDVVSGIYANTVMISHSAAEFCFDFITNFYPRSAVACRVYLSVPQVPRLLETLERAFDQLKQRIEKAQQQQAQTSLTDQQIDELFNPTQEKPPDPDPPPDDPPPSPDAGSD